MADHPTDQPSRERLTQTSTGGVDPRVPTEQVAPAAPRGESPDLSQPSREGEHARIIHDALGRLNAAGESDAQLTEPNLVGLRCFILREVRIIQNAARDLTIECDDNEMRAQANDTRARLAARDLQAAEAELETTKTMLARANNLAQQKHTSDPLRFEARALAAEAREDALREGLRRLFDSMGFEDWTLDAEQVHEARSLLSTQEPTR